MSGPCINATCIAQEAKGLEHKEAGNKLFQEGNWTSAIAEYSESIRRNPNDHRTYSNRAAVCDRSV